MNETSHSTIATIELDVVGTTPDVVSEVMAAITDEPATLRVRGFALDVKVIETPVDPILDRLPAMRHNLDAAIRNLRERIASLAEGIEREAGRIARDAAESDGHLRRLSTSSAGVQLDAAIVEFNALVEQRKILDYVENGAPEDRA